MHTVSGFPASGERSSPSIPFPSFKAFHAQFLADTVDATGDFSLLFKDSLLKSRTATMPHSLWIRSKTQEHFMKSILPSLLLIATTMTATSAAAEQVGEISTDWSGNDIVIEAITDPEVKGVTCHLSYFSRGFIDRLSQGNWFEDPSNSSIACRQTGPVVVGDIETDEDGEEVFSEGRSLIFKSLSVRRIYDKANNTLIYVSYARQIQEGSAKMAISTVPLFDEQVSWAEGRPD
jgi:CreA protein